MFCRRMLRARRNHKQHTVGVHSAALGLKSFFEGSFRGDKVIVRGRLIISTREFVMRRTHLEHHTDGIVVGGKRRCFIRVWDEVPGSVFYTVSLVTGSTVMLAFSLDLRLLYILFNVNETSRFIVQFSFLNIQ